MVANLALPDNQNLDSKAPKRSQIRSIPLGIAVSLIRPELRIRSWDDLPESTPMHVPEATMNHDCFVMAIQQDVWTTRILLRMESVAKAHSVYEASNDEFWLGIPASDSGHIRTALPSTVNVHRSYLCNER